MDQKTWLWGKRSLEKSIFVNTEAEIFVEGNEKDGEMVAPLLCECNEKDRLMAEHSKATQEANTGRERTKALVAIGKQELETVLEQNLAANERLVHLNAALKNCMQQLSSLKVEKDKRIKLEKAHKKLESKYTEARKKLADLTIENYRLTKTLVKKEEIIENVNNRLLEKDLKMRNRHADMAKLEAERQKLRLLVRKRILGPAKTKPSNQFKAVDRRLSLMKNRICQVEEENKILKESAYKKENEIRFLKEEVARMKCDEQNNGMRRLNNKDNLDHLENLKLINYDLDQQLSAAKVEIKESFQKVAFLEMELEDRNHYHEEIEATCRELQLQLASVPIKDEVRKDPEQVGKLLQTGLENTTELTNNKKLTQHFSLRDRMEADDLSNSLMIKDIVNTTETKVPSVSLYDDTCNTSYRPKNVVPWALAVVPSKKRCKGKELLRKLVFRRKRVLSGFGKKQRWALRSVL